MMSRDGIRKASRTDDELAITVADAKRITDRRPELSDDAKRSIRVALRKASWELEDA